MNKKYTSFLGPTRVLNSNSISIGLSQ